MNSEMFTNELDRIASSNGFATASEELTDAWSASGAGIEAVEPILRFMETHPFIDYGMPGALVHFVETFYGKGYEQKLVESIERTPTTHTVWMLNRVINGTKSPDTRRYCVSTLEHVLNHPSVDSNTKEMASRFLQRLAE